MKALKNVRFTRKTAVLVIIVAAVLLAALVLLCSGGGGMETTEERTAYLASLGWEVDAASETGRDVVLPEELDGVLLQYNELQKQQGFDLTQYKGRRVKRYTYEVTNYPSGEQGVEAGLLIYKNTVIAGEVLSASLGGFIHGLAMPG